MRDDRPRFRDLQPDGVRIACGDAALRLVRRDPATEAVVARELVAFFLLAAHRVETLLRAEARVGVAARHERVGVFAIERQPLGLGIRREGTALARSLVPPDPKPMQSVVDRLDRTGNETLLIGVLDAKYQRSTILSSEEKVVERRAHAADVQLACGRWREANAHVGHRCK